MLCQSFQKKQNDYTSSDEKNGPVLLDQSTFALPGWNAKVTAKVAIVHWAMLSDWTPF